MSNTCRECGRYIRGFLIFCSELHRARFNAREAKFEAEKLAKSREQEAQNSQRDTQPARKI